MNNEHIVTTGRDDDFVAEIVALKDKVSYLKTYALHSLIDSALQDKMVRGVAQDVRNMVAETVRVQADQAIFTRLTVLLLQSILWASNGKIALQISAERIGRNVIIMFQGVGLNMTRLDLQAAHKACYTLTSEKISDKLSILVVAYLLARKNNANLSIDHSTERNLVIKLVLSAAD